MKGNKLCGSGLMRFHRQDTGMSSDIIDANGQIEREGDGDDAAV